MADRLTQLQDAVNQQADNFTNSLGVLQLSANKTPFAGLANSTGGSSANAANDNKNATPASGANKNNPSSAAEQERQQQQQHEDHTNLFSQLIARTAKDIEQLIDSLPVEESSADLQASSLRKLEDENVQAADKLAEVVAQGEAVLKDIQSALHDIAQSQLDIQKMEASSSA